MVRGPEGLQKVPKNHSVRKRIAEIAVSENGVGVGRDATRFYQHDLRIDLLEVCDLIRRAAEDEWQLWTKKSEHTDHRGEPHYCFWQSVLGPLVFVKFAISSEARIFVISMHYAESRGLW